MIEVDGNRLSVRAPMTLAAAAALMKQGVDAIATSDPVFDLAAVSDVDSSGLAVVFAWMRAAQALGKSIRIANPPQNLLSLAEVYGVTELLPLA